MRRKAAAFPGEYSLDALRRVWTVRGFDEAYTAPHHGFRDAADYYHRASALRVIDRIRVPTLIVTAEDDPFVPTGPFRDPAVTGNPHITVVITRHGGHCAYVEHAPTPSTTATGRSARSSGSSRRADAAAISSSSKLRTLPFFFVLEVDEHVAAAGRPVPDDVGPARDVVRRVAFVAQPEVSVVRRDLHRRGQLLAVGDAERQVARAQPRVDLVVEPRGVAELERGAARAAERCRERRRTAPDPSSGSAEAETAARPSFGPSVAAVSRNCRTRSPAVAQPRVVRDPLAAPSASA